MAHHRTLRRSIWASLALELAGLAFDAVWHAMHPEFAAATRAEMIEHLSSVHLPIYLGVFCVVLTTALALLDQIERSEPGVVLPIAFAGALISAAGESWHAYTHLQLRTHGGPLAAAVSFFGFLAVVSALWLSRGHRRYAVDDIDERRAA
jgi:FtsH-binding integral membrane protein